MYSCRGGKYPRMWTISHAKHPTHVSTQKFTHAVNSAKCPFRLISPKLSSTLLNFMAVWCCIYFSNLLLLGLSRDPFHSQGAHCFYIQNCLWTFHALLTTPRDMKNSWQGELFVAFLTNIQPPQIWRQQVQTWHQRRRRGPTRSAAQHPPWRRGRGTWIRLHIFCS